MLAQSEVFEDEILSRPENTDNPTEEMPEPHDHRQRILPDSSKLKFPQIIDSANACSFDEGQGLRTLAIQKQSSEVWRVFDAVKTEFGRFGDTPDKVTKKLDETGNTIDEAVHRSRQMERKLRKVEALPVDEASTMLIEVHADNELPEEMLEPMQAR